MCRCHSTHSRADFFTSHQLAIDLTNRRLASLDGRFVIHAQLARSQTTRIHRMHFRYKAIVVEFPELSSFKDNKHGVVHHIPTNGPPVHALARRLDQQKLTAAKAEFDEMEQLGIVRRSCSPWSSPLHNGQEKQWWRPPSW